MSIGVAASYSPGEATPSTTGAVAACGIVVVGTRNRAGRGSSLLGPVELVVWMSNCTSVLVATLAAALTVNWTVAVPFAGTVYGCEAGVAVTPAGRFASATVPDSAAPVWFVRVTPSVRVSPAPSGRTGVTRPTSCGTPAPRAHVSNSPMSGSRSSVPSTAGTTRTAS